MGLAELGSHWVGGGVRRACREEEGILGPESVGGARRGLQTLPLAWAMT